MADDHDKPIERASAWIDKELIRMAKAISAFRSESLAEVIERHLRPAVSREFRQIGAEMFTDLGGEAGGA